MERTFRALQVLPAERLLTAGRTPLDVAAGMVILADLGSAVVAAARARIPAAFVFAPLDACAVLEQHQADRAAVRHQHVLPTGRALGSARIKFPWFGGLFGMFFVPSISYSA